jgi:HEAT repeats
MPKDLALHSLLVDLRAGIIPEDELYTVIHRFGNEGLIEAKPDVERFLNHPNPEIRYIALNVLTFHWMCREHRSTCETFALNDPDSDNRRMGAAGLGALLEGTRDPKALQMLIRIFRDEKEEWDVRDAAYRSILYVLGRPASEQPPATKQLDYERDVNWERIREAEEIVKGAGTQ